jgi:hypothetical protein
MHLEIQPGAAQGAIPSVELTKKGEAYVATALLRPTGIPEGVDPCLWRKTVAERVECHLAIAEGLLCILDMMSVDVDLEEGGDLEPSLGWTARGQGTHSLDDRELDECDSEDSGDDEPSLAAPERHPQPGYWGFGCEPRSDQTYWAQGGSSDGEPNGDEADFDGGERDFPMLILGGNEAVAQ